MRELHPSIKTLFLVAIMGAIIGLGFFVKAQFDKSYDAGFDMGRAEYQKEINDWIVNSLNQSGEIKIRYLSTETGETTDLILVPKR